jgi:hypothetical protein
LPYATASDIETRLKASTGLEFNDDQLAAAELLCEAASAVIDACAGVTEPKDPPPILRFVAIEVVCRAMANPQGLSSEQETIGAYSYAQRYLAEGGGLWLKPLEEQMVRQAVHGRLSGSAEAKSLASDVCTLCRVAHSLCVGCGCCCDCCSCLVVGS